MLQVRRERSQHAVSSSLSLVPKSCPRLHSLHSTIQSQILTPKKGYNFFVFLRLTEGTTRSVPCKRQGRRRGRPTPIGPFLPNGRSHSKPRPLPSTPPPPLTHTPTSPGSGSTEGWLRETSGKTGQRTTPPKAQSWSTSIRSPAPQRLGHCTSRLRVFPPRSRYSRSLPHCTPGKAHLHFLETSVPRMRTPP